MLKMENKISNFDKQIIKGIYIYREREGLIIIYKLQSVLGSMVKPKTTPQKPDNVEMAVALEL